MNAKRYSQNVQCSKIENHFEGVGQKITRRKNKSAKNGAEDPKGLDKGIQVFNRDPVPSEM